MAESKHGGPRDAQRLVDALADWFDQVPLADRAESEEILRQAGLDPDAVGRRMRQLVERALEAPVGRSMQTTRSERRRGPHRPETSGGVESLRVAARGASRSIDSGDTLATRLRKSRDYLAWGVAVFVVGVAIGWLGGHSSREQDLSVAPARERQLWQREFEEFGAGGGPLGGGPAGREVADDTNSQGAARQWGETQGDGGIGPDVVTQMRAALPPREVPPPAPEGGAIVAACSVLDWAKHLAETKYRWTDRTQAMAVHIFSPDGFKQKLTMQVYTKPRPDSVDESLAVVRSPDDVERTSFLQLMKDGYVERLLYLPASRSIQQLASRQRDESFLGTDFTYRDLDILAEIPKWSGDAAARVLPSEKDAGDPIGYAIDVRLRDVSPYSHVVLWIDRDFYTARKLKLFDRDGAEAKVVTLDDIRKIDSIPTAHWIEMRDLKTGSRTLVEVTATEYNNGLGNRLFGDLTLAARTTARIDG